MLLASIGEGGKNLFDLEARNEALAIMKLKSYLDMENRPVWAKVADKNLAKKDKKTSKVAEYSRVNMFLQTWAPKHSNLSPKTKKMVNTGVKYGLKFDTLNPTKGISEQLPLWHHFGEDGGKRRINNTAPCQCLRNMHHAKYAEDAIVMASRLDDPEHIPRKTCMCIACMEDRTLVGCENPHICAKMARIRLDSMLPKWDPRVALPDEPQPATNDREDEITFVGPARISSLTEGFRIFTRQKASPGPPEVAGPMVLAPQNGENIAFAIAGATRLGGTAEARAGAGMVARQIQAQGTAIRVPDYLPQSKQSAEIVAALLSTRSTDPGVKLRIESGKDGLLKAMSKKLPVWEDRGWLNTPNSQSLQALTAALRERTAETKIAVVTASAEVEEAHSLARAGAEMVNADHVDLRIPDHLQLKGAKLSTLTQATAYRMIKSLKEKVHRKATGENVLATQEATKALFKNTPTEKMIWKSIRNKDISRQVRNFMWKTLHGAHRIGKFWAHIPEMEDRATCQHCGVVESMEHIVTECSRPGQKEIWALAETLWRKSHTTWPTVSFGGLMGAALATFPGNKEKSRGSARLYRILMTESMYLIWKIRWVALMNERLEIDRNLTNRVRFGKQHAIPSTTVLETWKGSLLNENELPPLWLREPEVLGDEAEIDNGKEPHTVADRFVRNAFPRGWFLIPNSPEGPGPLHFALRLEEANLY
ncbi:hypothetical protein B0H16DRAFT_1777204 [Mycena metata]|uniref:Reverse transcriptase zinc-binding domain-containing protein n=1 Tax=Mycena metata TaxID=1033252 RepID=A0AAD7NPX7_9AGAR|nr:hypothetical protein B0H16DRAFT_1777204 [Mycena metata]